MILANYVKEDKSMKTKTSLKVLASAAAAAYATKNALYFYNNQYRTMKTVTRLDDNIWTMDYRYDYGLDALLKKGVSNTAELLAYVSKSMLFGTKLLKMGSGDFACSTFDAFNDNGEHILGRNFDYKKAPCMIVWTHPNNGYASVSVADCNFMLYGDVNKPTSCLNRLQTILAPYCCMDGMNEKGLSIAILELKAKPTSQDTGKPNISTTVAIRAVLDKCADVSQAVELLKSYDMHDAFFCNYHYQITDASGVSVIVEYVNNEMRLFYSDSNESARYPYQFATNYFLSEDGDNSKAFGYDRAEIMQQKLAETAGRLSENEAMDLLQAVHLNYKHEKYPWQVTTLWSVVYNMNSLTVTLAAGLDYNHIYRLNVANPSVVRTDEPLHI